MAKKRIITLCGSGIASSTIVAQKVKKACEEKGIDVDVKPIAFRELQGEILHADLIISITPGLKVDNVPVVNGVSFLTGVGEKNVLDEIFKILEEGKK
ncbi:PTS sugar transporter subunit IIB [Calorimonas adulescens]|jgi:PTS system, Lactose/Cellobiose specific IIB subunit.|uniref:PTS sugar transporter subunit IIB n=1 Tax=Calorimonas adulescens TaxID=2606906 RepID=A0A5D8QBH0_9THEO|nr:PTS sugar transporter subunit IIB [Calorimonas adulescens]TZE81499.1 PTS sugar transporter subunit IIB [Calorimonas adulescens]